MKNKESVEVFDGNDLPNVRLSPTANPIVFVNKDTGVLFVLEETIDMATGKDIHYLKRLNTNKRE